MKQKMKRAIAKLLILSLALTMMPMTSFGASGSGVWKVGNTTYDALQTAVDNVAANGTIIMQEDFTNSRTPIDAGGKTFTIDLGENTLTNFSSVTWENADGVTIQNGSITANMEAFRVPSGSTIILDDVTVSNASSSYGAITVEDGGTLQIVTGTFSVPDNCAQSVIQVETGGTVAWGRQTAIPSGWQSAKSFTAGLTTDYQATLDGVGYARLGEALADAQNGSEVVLLKDVYWVTINDTGKSFTLDLNQRTVGGSENVSAGFMITTSGSITVKNGTVICDEPDWGALSVYAGNVTIEDVSFTNLNSGSYAIENEGTVHIKSGAFTSGNADEGAIYTATGATTTVDTGSIVEPSNWKTASSFTATYNPVVEVRDSETATTGTKYADIQTAIDEGEGDYLYLLKNVSEVTDLLFNEDAATIFDLGGNTLTMKVGKYISIYDPVTLKNGTIKLLNKDQVGGMYIDAEGSNVTFDNLTVLSELASFVQVSRGNLVLGAGDYQASGTAETGFCVYEPGTITIKDGYATDLPEEEWEEFASMHIGKSIENGAYAISGLAESYIYEGEAVTPAVVVKNTDRNAELAVQQYSTIFSDNNQLGKAKVTIIGKNNFGGKLEATFNLLPCAPDSITVTPFENFPDSALTVSWTHPQAEQVSGYKLELYDGADKVKEVTASTQTVTFGDLNRNKEYNVVITPGVIIDNATVYGQASDPAFGTTDKTNLLAGKTIILSQTSYTYDGTAKKPAVTIDGVDASTYKVTYKNNVNAGTATVTVTGTGDYKGSLTATFTINKASISGKSVTLSYTSTTYNGSAKKPTVTISGLTKDTHYTVSYKNNTNAGTATVTITGKGNYTGTITKSFTIKKATMTGIKATGKTVTYNGKAHTITLSGVPDGAKVSYKTSSAGTYSTTKPTRTSAGTTTVYYKVEKSNYNTVTGSAKIVVNKRAISKATLSKTTYVYSGSAKKPTATVKNSSGTKLTKGTHYTVSYKNNTKVGKATVTIKGKGNYKGTITKTFKINPKPTSITSLTKAKKAFTVKWSKKTTQTTGYQIYYGTAKTRTGGKKVTITKNSTTSKKITNLKSGKKYYVWVRTYKTVDGVKYYSTWSDRKAVTTK